MSSKLANFFKVIVEGQTYLNLFYLLLTFPLSIVYFVFLVTGISLGIGLLITIIGIPILVSVILLSRLIAKFECQLTTVMLGIKIPLAKPKKFKTFIKKIQNFLEDSFTWRSLIYLFIKFPLGILSFIILVTLLSISLSLIATPIIYHLSQIGIIPGTVCMGIDNNCFLNSYFSAIIIGMIGMLLLFIFLHALNGLAKIYGLLTKAMLEK